MNTLVKALALAALLPLGLRADFADNCTTFNSTLWSKATWAMGRGNMAAANVNPSGGGVYNFELPANSYDGGEIYSNSAYSFGQSEAEIKCANVQGVINSIYLYQGVGSASDEIDIEVYKNNGGTWEIAFTIYQAGTITYRHTYNPTWDPSAAYNDYLIDYSSTGVSFYINGGLEGSFSTAGSLPTHPMNIQLIGWWPTWLTAVQSSSNKYMQVNWIKYTAH